MKFIDEFKNEYDFLSNFYQKKFNFRGFVWPSAEHAYQACKAVDPHDIEKIRKAPTAKEAKRLGRKIKLDFDWDEVKVSDMYWILKNKFSDPELRQKLLDTEEDILIEGNWWGDKVWGVCRGEGENLLGQLLMLIRSEIRANGG